MGAYIFVLISPAAHDLCLSIGPSYCLHWKLMISTLALSVRHGDSLSAFCYCNWEHLLVYRLSHPGGGLCHFLSQLLSLMQVKPLSRLLMMTEKQESGTWVEDDTILTIRGICCYHVLYGSNCPQVSQGWQS